MSKKIEKAVDNFLEKIEEEAAALGFVGKIAYLEGMREIGITEIDDTPICRFFVAYVESGWTARLRVASEKYTPVFNSEIYNEIFQNMEEIAKKWEKIKNKIESKK